MNEATAAEGYSLQKAIEKWMADVQRENGFAFRVREVDSLITEIFAAGFRLAMPTEKAAAAPIGRAADLLARAHGDPRRDELKPFEGLVRRLAWRCHLNGCKDARDVFDAVASAKIREWKNVGEKGIRDICLWLATKFPTDPPPRESVDQTTPNGH